MEHQRARRLSRSAAQPLNPLALTLLLLCLNQIDGQCSDHIVDYFCGSTGVPSTDHWLTVTGSSSENSILGAEVGPSGTGTGLKIQRGGYLYSKSEYPSSKESPLTLRAVAKTTGSLPLTFDICTRSNAVPVADNSEISGITLDPGSSGAGGTFIADHSTHRYYVQSGACLHLARADTSSSQWYMAFIFAGVAASCPPTSLVALDVTPGTEWDIRIVDEGGDVTANVRTLGGSTNGTYLSASCTAIAASSNKVVMFNRYKDYQQIDTTALLLTFAYVSQVCLHTTSVDTHIFSSTAQPCIDPITVSSGTKELAATTGTTSLDQSHWWDIKLNFQNEKAGSQYVNTQGFLIFMHISRVAVSGTGNRDVSVKMQVELCGSQMATVVHNPFDNDELPSPTTVRVNSEPMFLQGMAMCSSSISNSSALNLQLYTTRDFEDASGDGSVRLVGSQTDTQSANFDYGGNQLIVTAVRILMENLANATGTIPSLNAVKFQLTGSAQTQSFLQQVSASDLSVTTTELKQYIAIFFDAPVIRVPDGAPSYETCIRFRLMVDGAVQGNKSLCIDYSTSAEAFDKLFTPLQMHTITSSLSAGAHSISVEYEQSKSGGSMAAGNLSVAGPWNVHALAVSDEAFATTVKIYDPSECTTTTAPTSTRTPATWVTFDNLCLTVDVKHSNQELILLASLDRLKMSDQRDIAFRIVKSPSCSSSTVTTVLSEISSRQKIDLERSFSWHGTDRVEEGTYTYKVMWNAEKGPIPCSPDSYVEHRLTALRFPDLSVNSATPSTIPRLIKADSNASVTISGAHFTGRNSANSARMGVSSCLSTTWVSPTSLVCQIPPGVSGDHPTIVTTDLVGIQSGLHMFNYSLPSLSSSGNSPAKGATQNQTLIGSNLAVHDYSPDVFVGDTRAVTTWNSESSVTIKPAHGAATVPLTVKVGNQASDHSSDQQLHKFDSPYVSALSPTTLATSGGSTLTVFGGNFGIYSHYSVQVTIDDQTCQATTWISDSMVLCLHPPGIGGELRVSAQHLGEEFVATPDSTQNCTNRFCVHGLTQAFSYSAPTMSNSLYNNLEIIEDIKYSYAGIGNLPTVAGETITIWGTNFGESQTSKVDARVGGTACDATVWTPAPDAFTPVHIKCRMAPGVNIQADVTLTLARQVATANDMFTFDLPHTNNDQTFNAPANSGGQNVTIKGNNFGTFDLTAILAVGGSECIATNWGSDSSVVCRLPNGVGIRNSVTINYQNISDNYLPTDVPLHEFTFDRPAELMVGQPVNETNLHVFHASGTSGINITGQNLGSNDYSLAISIGGTAAERSQWTADTLVVCRAASGVGADIKVIATAGTLIGTSETIYSYQRPGVSTLSPPNGITTGAEITIFGEQFGLVDFTLTARVGGSACSATKWISESSVRCHTVLSFDVALDVVVTIGTQFSTLSSSFTYDQIHPPIPAIASISNMNGARIGGTNITITGNFTGPEALRTPSDTTPCRLRNPPATPGSVSCPFVDAGDMIWEMFVGQRDCANLVVATACAETNWMSESSIVCVTPAGVSRNRGLLVRTRPPEHSPFADAVSEIFLDNTFTYDDPVLEILSPQDIPSFGNSSLTVRGKNFGMFDISVKMRVGFSACASSEWMSDSTLLCKTSSGRDQSLPLQLTVMEHNCSQLGAGFTYSGEHTLSYHGPVLNQSLPTNIPATGIDVISVTGANFGFADYTPVALLESTYAAATTWTSDSSLNMKFGSGVGGALDLVLDYEGDSTLGTVGDRYSFIDAMSYDGPSASSVKPSSPGAATGGYNITIFGQAFGTIDYTPTAFVGRTDCLQSAWFSESSVRCIVPQGSHAGLNALIAAGVEIGGQRSNNEVFEYQDKGVEKISIDCSACKDPALFSGFGFPEAIPFATQPAVHLVDIFNQEIGVLATNISVTVATEESGVELKGTTSMMTVKGSANFTDLYISGATSLPIRLNFSAPQLPPLLSSEFNVLFSSCPPSLVSANPRVFSATGGKNMLVELFNYRNFTEVKFMFVDASEDPLTSQLKAAGTITEITFNQKTSVSSFAILTPVWPHAPNVKVGMELGGQPAEGCFDVIIRDPTQPSVISVAPPTCDANGGSSVSILFSDIVSTYSQEDLTATSVTISSGATAVATVPLTLDSFIGDGSRLLSFTCPAVTALGDYDMQIAVSSGAKAGQVVCCSNPVYAPATGFVLKYVAPPGSASPANVIPLKSHTAITLTLYFVTQKYGIASNNDLATCTPIFGSETGTFGSIVAEADGSVKAVANLPLQAPTGVFPRTVPISIECTVGTQISTGASVVYYAESTPGAVSPQRVEVYGGFVDVIVSNPVYPLTVEEVSVTVQNPSGSAPAVAQFAFVSQGIQESTFRVQMPLSTDLTVGAANITFAPTIGPEGIPLSFFESTASVTYFQPDPIVANLNPSTVSAAGNEEVVMTIKKLPPVPVTAPAQVSLKMYKNVNSTQTVVTVGTVRFSDIDATEITFSSLAFDPGPVVLEVSLAADTSKTGTGLLTYNGIGVSATCTAVRKDTQSEMLSVTAGQTCVVASQQGSSMTVALQGFGSSFAGGAVSVAGRLLTSAEYTTVFTNPLTLQIDMGAYGGTIAPGDDGCPPVLIQATMSIFLTAEPTKLAVVTFNFRTPPCLSSAKFSPSGVSVLLHFNQPTNQGGVLGSEAFDCNTALQVLGKGSEALGEGGACKWKNNRLLVMSLGPGEDSDLVNLGDFIELQSGAGITPSEGFLQLTASGQKLVKEPDSVVLPAARISGPNTASACPLDSVDLLGAVLSPRGVRMAWSSDDDSINAAISAETVNLISVSSSLLTPGLEYKIMFAATDFLGRTSIVAEHALTQSSSNIPLVKVEGSRPYLVSKSIFFIAIVQFSKCVSEKKEMSFLWKVTLKGSSDIVYQSSKPSLDVPAGTLQVDQTYTVKVTAGGDGQVASDGFLDFKTEYSPLVATIAGGDRIQPRILPITLDPGLSRDPDICTLDPNTNLVYVGTDPCFTDLTGETECSVPCVDNALQYSWKCFIGENVCRKKDFAQVSLPDEKMVTVDLQDLLNDPPAVRFEVTISKGKRFTTSSVMITIVDLTSVPTLDVSIGANRKVDAQGVFFINAGDSLRASSASDYCDNVDCNDVALSATYRYSFAEIVEGETVEGQVLDGTNPTVTPTGLMSPGLLINPNVFVPGKRYAVNLDLVVGSGVLAAARAIIEINEPPGAGKCSISPTTGTELTDIFAASCVKWMDEDLPVSFVFGFKVSGSTDAPTQTPPQLSDTYEMRLPAGTIDVSFQIWDALESAASFSTQVVVNEAAADDSTLDALEGASDDSGKLGDTSGLLQSADASAGQSGDLDSSASRRRTLLASSAAYRMRVRRLMLRKLSGASKAVDRTSGGPMVNNVQRLGSRPEEVVPFDGNPDSSPLENQANLLNATINTMTPTQLSGQAGNELMDSMANMAGAVSMLPLDMRDRTLTSILRSVLQVTRTVGQQMNVGEPRRQMGKDKVISHVQKMAVSTSKAIFLNDSDTNMLYNFNIESTTVSTVIVISNYFGVPWTGNLPQNSFAISPVVGLQVISASSSSRRGLLKEQIVGQTESASSVRAVQPNGPSSRDRTVPPRVRRDAPISGLKVTFTVDLGTLEIRNTVDAAEQDLAEVEKNIRFSSAQTTRCLHWDTFKWSEEGCELPVVRDEGKTIDCFCDSSGEILIAYYPQPVPLGEQPVYSTHEGTTRFHGQAFWYSFGIGLAIFVITLTVEWYWHYYLTKETKLHSHDFENDISRRPAIDKHTVVGWYGDRYKHSGPDRRGMEHGAMRDLNDLSADLTLILMIKWSDLGGQYTAKMESLKEMLKEEIAIVLDCSKQMVCLDEVDRLSAALLQMHLYFKEETGDLEAEMEGRSPHDFASEFQQVYRDTGFQGIKGLDKLLLAQNVMMGYDPLEEQKSMKEVPPDGQRSTASIKPENPPPRAPMFMRSMPSETQKSWNSSVPAEGPLVKNDYGLRPQDVQVTYAGMPQDVVDRMTRVPSSLQGPGHPPRPDALSDTSKLPLASNQHTPLLASREAMQPTRRMPDLGGAASHTPTSIQSYQPPRRSLNVPLSDRNQSYVSQASMQRPLTDHSMANAYGDALNDYLSGIE